MWMRYSIKTEITREGIIDIAKITRIRISYEEYNIVIFTTSGEKFLIAKFDKAEFDKSKSLIDMYLGYLLNHLQQAIRIKYPFHEKLELFGYIETFK